jgi:hypothetical protein
MVNQKNGTGNFFKVKRSVVSSLQSTRKVILGGTGFPGFMRYHDVAFESLAYKPIKATIKAVSVRRSREHRVAQQ